MTHLRHQKDMLSLIAVHRLGEPARQFAAGLMKRLALADGEVESLRAKLKRTEAELAENRSQLNSLMQSGQQSENDKVKADATIASLRQQMSGAAQTHAAEVAALEVELARLKEEGASVASSLAGAEEECKRLLAHSKGLQAWSGY